MTENGAQFPSRRAAIAVVFGTFFLLVTVQYLIWLAGWHYRKEVFLAEAIVIVPALVYCRRAGYSIKEVFRLRWPGADILKASAMIGIGVLVLSDGFERLAALFLPESEALSVLEKDMQASLGAQNVFELFIIILTVIVFAGVLEEMLFRGFLMGALEQSGDVTKAVMTTAFIFSFFHYVWLIWPWAFVQILILGVILGAVAWRADSIFPAAVIHMINNTATLLFLHSDGSPIWWYEWKGQVAPWILLPAFGLVWIGFKKLYLLMEVPDLSIADDREVYTNEDEP